MLAFSNDDLIDYENSMKEIDAARGGLTYNHVKARGSMRFSKVAEADAALVAAKARLERAASNLGKAPA